jgi:hypothetical protein
MNTKTQQITSSLLALLSVAGLGGTIFLTNKIAPKAKKKVEEATEKKGDKLTFKEVMKAAAKDYIPVCICGGATAISIISSTILSRKTEASLGATAVALDGLYRRYKGKVTNVFGKDAQDKIFSKFASEDKKDDMPKVRPDGKKLYYCDYIGFFYAIPERVKDAYANLNMRLNANPCSGMVDEKQLGYCTFGDFIRDCDGEVLDLDTFNKFKNWGWSTEYLNETSMDYWVYIGENEAEGPDDHYTNLIFMSEDPIEDPKSHMPSNEEPDSVDPDFPGENK